MQFTLKPGPGLDLSRQPGWVRSATKATPAPARPAPAPKATACPATSAATVEYTEIDPDHELDRHVVVLARAAVHNAAREIGLTELPPIKFFEPLTSALKSYRDGYWRGGAFKTWRGHRDLLGISDPTRSGGTIWLRASLRGDELAATARHETFHFWEHRTGVDYGEAMAEAFARGEVEFR